MLFFTREHRIVLSLCLVVLVILSIGIIYNRQRAPIATEPLFMESPLPPVEKSDSLLVHVAGKVLKPGVYTLKYGGRVQDAVKLAGGAAKDGDPHALNLAAFLKDGEKIEVPSRAEAGSLTSVVAPVRGSTVSSALAARPATAPTPSGKPPPDWLMKHRVNLNRASMAQLQQLPGIGPGMAQRIMAYRQEHGSFSSTDDLRRVSGIGAKRFAALKDLVTV